MPGLEIKEFNFLSTLTGVVVLIYMLVSAWAFAKGTLTYQEFSTAVGPLSGMLVGYWIKGQA